MSDDRHIIIGDKKSKDLWGNMIKDTNVVQNSREKYYYITIGLFGLASNIYGNSKTIIIMPETPEHKELTELLETKDNEAIEKYAQILAIKYLPPEYVYHMIEKVKRENYNQGRRDTQSKLLDVLGIKESNNTPYLMRQY